MIEKLADGREPPPGFTIVNDAGTQRLDLFLYERLPGKTRSFLQKLIKDGRVALDAGETLRRSSYRVKPGQTVAVCLPPPPPSEIEPRFTPFKIVYEDEDLAAIVKPAGLTVHPSHDLRETTLVSGLLWCMKNLSGMAGADRPGIVHRLDRDTSGIMIVAKHDEAHHKLALMFKAHQMHKTYVAVCHVKDTARDGVIDAPIGRNMRHRKQMAVRYDLGRAAITEYQVREVFGPYAVVEAHPRSGRTHQIRVHLKFMGMPLVCDALYGREKALCASAIRGAPRTAGERPLIFRQALHAAQLRFTHPRTGAPLRLEAALPADMLRLIGFLRRTFGGGS